MKLLPSLLTAVASVSLLSTAAHATTLATWDGWADTDDSVINADFTAAGITASIDYLGSRVLNDFGSNDGTFGTLAGSAATAGRGLLVSENNGGSIVTLSIENNSASAFRIDTLNFDYLTRVSSSDGTGNHAFDVTYTSGDLGVAGTSIGTASNIATGSNVSNFSDFDLETTALTDKILGIGESALFTITFSGRASGAGFVSGVLDNVAVTGTSVVPEPSSFTLLSGCLVLGAAMIRRRR